MADILKTPDQRLQDESNGEVQFNTKTRKSFEGAEDETVQLTSFDSQKSVRTSTPVGKTVIPRHSLQHIPRFSLQHISPSYSSR